MEERDGTRESAVRLRYPRRHNEATSMRRPDDPGARAARPELVEPLCEAMTRLRPTRAARSVPRQGGEVCSLLALTNRHHQQAEQCQ
jgi:hypothetical protein